MTTVKVAANWVKRKNCSLNVEKSKSARKSVKLHMGFIKVELNVVVGRKCNKPERTGFLLWIRFFFSLSSQ